MSIGQKICKFLLKIAGWKAECRVEVPKKCVFCVAPHTSNWDFIIGKIGYKAVGGVKPNFLIKSEWFRFPFNLLFGPLGGIPVYRDKKEAKGSLIKSAIEQANSRETFHLAITPEGTRGTGNKWKRGFYHIATGANIPIMIVALDFGKKIVAVDHAFYPTGDVDADIKAIQKWYVDNDIKGKYPDNFIVEE